MKYTIRKCDSKPSLKTDFNAPEWSQAEIAEISNFLPESSDHRPKTFLKLLYDDQHVYGLFMVDDQYVRCVETQLQGPVCRDSCVEFFFRPKADAGYFNFEFNCGGCVLCFYIEDPSRGEKGFKKYCRLEENDLKKVEIHHTMPSVVEPEVAEPTVWRLGFAIPVAMLEKYAGPLNIGSGAEWKGNFYKCGDGTSHPHWATWAPIDKKNFHLPQFFQSIVFE